MKSFAPLSVGVIVPIIGLICTGTIGTALAHAQNAPITLPTASIVVKDAMGSPVEGAVACIGTVIGLMEYGQATTNASGIAHFNTLLPEGPATIYYTASKEGRGAQTSEQYVAPTPPPLLTAHVQLPASPGGSACPGGGSGPTAWLTDAIQGLMQALEAPSTLQPRELFEVKLILKRPPPVEIVVALESSNPRVVSVPRQVILRPGERTATVLGEVTGEVRDSETVTLVGRLEADPKQVLRTQILVQPAGAR